MITLFKFETLKIITKKSFWVLLIVAIIFNMFSMWWFNRPDEFSPSYADTKVFYNELRQYNNQEKIEFLNDKLEELNAILLKEQLETEQVLNPNSPFIEEIKNEYNEVYEKYKEVLDRKQDYNAVHKSISLVNEALSELDVVSNYEEYLEEIQSNSDRLLNTTIFQSSLDKFSIRNIQKTANDFQSMKEINIQYDVNKGISLLLNSPTRDLTLVLIIVVVCFSLITDEKDKKLFFLIKSTPNGNSMTICAKILALFVAIFGIHLLMLLSTSFFASYAYGLGDLSRSIQSVPELMGSTLKISLLQFFLLLFSVKTIGLFLIALIILFISICSRHSIITLICISILTIFNVSLNLIPAQSSWNWFKYLNLFSICCPYQTLTNYVNLNFFNYPVNVLYVFFTFLGLMGIFFLVINFFFFVRKDELESGSFPIKNFVTNTNVFKLLVPKKVLTFEIIKHMFNNKAALILILFILLQAYSIGNQNQYFSPDDYYYKYYMTQLEGPLTQEKEQYILSEKATFDEAIQKKNEIENKFNNAKINQIEMVLALEPYQLTLQKAYAFEPIFERYIYVKTHEGAQFLYDAGYQKLFGISNEDEGLISGLKMLIILIMSLCGVFAIEYKSGMYKILNTTKKGISNTIKMKILVSTIFCFFVFLVAYIPDLLFIKKFYGFSGLNQFIISIPEFQSFCNIPIWSYILLIFLLRFFVCLGFSYIVLAISLLAKNNSYAALTATTLFLIPVILHLVGNNILDFLSLNSLLTINQLILVDNLWKSLFSVFPFIGVVVGSLCFIFRRFGKMIPFNIKIYRHKNGNSNNINQI